VKYRHAWPGFLLLFALAVLLASLLLWGDRFLTPSPAGGIIRLLQSRGGLGPVSEPSPAAAAITSSRADVEEASSAGSSGPETPSLVRGVAGDNTPTARASQPGSAPPEAIKAHYALDLGRFTLDRDAEWAEAQLNQAGFSTVRFREQAPGRLFTVSARPPVDSEAMPIEPGPQGLPTLKPTEGAEVPIARALPLRSAVELAVTLRAAGYDVRVVAEADRTGQIRLRHGRFASRQEAEAVGREIARLGMPNEVVRVR
jgi:cell division septation protein DedD